VIIGIISDRTDMNHAFAVVGVMFLAAGVLWLFGMKVFEARYGTCTGRLNS